MIAMEDLIDRQRVRCLWYILAATFKSRVFFVWVAPDKFPATDFYLKPSFGRLKVSDCQFIISSSSSSTFKPLSLSLVINSTRYLLYKQSDRLQPT